MSRFTARVALSLALLTTPALAEDEPAFRIIDTDEGLSLHKEIYVFPATWSNRYEGSETEVVFQLSAKLQIKKTRLFIGYTQVAFWQMYNTAESSPFRETNYNPEIFYRITPANSSWERWGADFGIEHVSNGKSEPDSRSWNRIYAAGHYQHKGLLVYVKAWHRFKEDECPLGADGLEVPACRDDPSFDDNPDIVDFMGYGEAHLRYRWSPRRKLHELHLMARGNLATGKGALELDYSYPTGTKDLRWFGKAWYGYGESLIDYDRSVTRVGIGLLLQR